MSGKITEHFSADFSEAEANMANHTRKLKSYERAVKALDSRAGGGFSKLNSGASRVLGQVKEMASAFGAAGLSAGLVPGVGIAAIGVAGVVAGVKYIANKYKEAAESAKRISEYMSRAAERSLNDADATRTDKGRLEFTRKRTEELKRQWTIAVLAGHGDERILAAREAFEISRSKLADLERKAKKEADDEKEAARKDWSKKQEEDFKREAANRARNLEIQKKASEAQAKADEEQKKRDEEKKKRDEEEAERLKEIADLRYERAWKFATTEQRIAQVRKEGREAQAAYDKNASSENLITLEKARRKWLDLRDEINGAKKDAGGGSSPADTSGRTVGADGKLRRGGVIVSAEDAARSDKTRARDASLMRDTMGGRISESGKVGSSNASNKADKLLEDIRDSLKATYVGTPRRA